MGCTLSVLGPGTPFRACNSWSSHYTAEERCPFLSRDKMTYDPNWGYLAPGVDGTILTVTPGGDCHERWVATSIIGHTPKGNELNN